MRLQNILKEKYKLPEKDISLLFDNMEKVSFTKKNVILKEGQQSYYVYFVEKGIVRSFISRDGKDITIYIVAENEVPLDSVKLTEVSRSRLSIEAIEDVDLWRISRKQLGELCNKSVVFANFCRELLEERMQELEVYWTEYYWMDKKRQYELMMKQHPRLLQRIPLKDIASYLNVTPQSLSRIRASAD